MKEVTTTENKMEKQFSSESTRKFTSQIVKIIHRTQILLFSRSNSFFNIPAAVS